MMAQQPPPQGVLPPELLQQHPAQLVNQYYPENTPDLTGGLPLNLDSLRDGPPGSKPFYPYSTLIRYAIKGAPNQKLLLEDIYYAIESRFPYFRTAPPGWKNSVRHNLSLNPCFEKVPRPLTDRGKGSYWTVNDNVDPRTGVHRVRKKKGGGKSGKGRGAARTSTEPEAEFNPDQPPFDQTFPPVPIPPKDGPSNQAPPFVPPQYPFDPGFPQMLGGPSPQDGMRYAPPLFPPDEHFEIDEHGNVNWHAAWLKELAQLHQLTEEQQKAGADQEWYRMMLFRVRNAMLAPPMNPGEPPVHLAAPPPPPPQAMPGQSGAVPPVPQQER